MAWEWELGTFTQVSGWEEDPPLIYFHLNQTYTRNEKNEQFSAADIKERRGTNNSPGYTCHLGRTQTEHDLSHK